MTDQAPQPNFYAIIPANVRYCREIEMGAKLLYGEITSLTHAAGFCWASNDYFAQLYDVDIRTIQRWLTSLKQQKFIVIELEKTGIKTLRKIWISREIQKISTEGQNCHPPMTKMSSPHDKNVTPIVNTNTKEEERGGKAPEPPPPVSFFSHKRVKMKAEKYNELVKEFGQKKVSELIDRLDEYADINPKRFRQYACHAAVVRKWIRDDSEKKTSSPHQKSSKYLNLKRDESPVDPSRVMDFS